MSQETIASENRQSALERNALLESLRWKKFSVLDDGFVCLVDVMGDDSSIFQAARVSYGEGTKKVSDDRTLIRYLLRHRHTTPFEMAEILEKLAKSWRLHHDLPESAKDSNGNTVCEITLED